MSEKFDINSLQGLSGAEVAVRIKRDGFNELPSSRQRSIFAIAYEVVKEPMFLLLLASGTIYLFLGDIQEALMLLGFVFVVMGITIFQERKTERALEALRDLSSPRALVIRDGERKRIAGREVVRGDLLVLFEGDRVPADAVLLWGLNLSVDESLLTGESVAVRKAAADGPVDMGPPGGDDLPFVYSGTLVVQGEGVAQVRAIGAATEIGKIGKALQTVETEETRLQKETRKLVRNLALIGIALCLLVVLVYGLTRKDWLDGLLAGLTMAMAILPEEFPVVLTIFMALGAWRISQNQVLTRQVPAVETLGSTTVLCVDKTGTLTLNRMSVRKIYARGELYNLDYLPDRPLPENFHEVLEYSILASKLDPFDPMEKAFIQLGDHYLAGTDHLHKNWSLEQEYPLTRKQLAMSHVWRSPDGEDYIIATKGAPEAIFDLCHLNRTYAVELSGWINTMAAEGLRVLGIARAQFKKPVLPDQQHDFDYEFLGLVGLADPIRPTVPAAIRECHEAGIRVIMITGDYPVTARSIGREIGLRPTGDIVTGPELDKMSEAELQQRIKTTNIFARVIPEQKLLLVNALKANGEIVAMTGDGVNDAPALKAAHIGIAMGERGTDVAREASAMVLLNDDFSSMVQAVKMGRRIFDNLKKAMAYIFAIHVPIAGMSLVPVLFKWPLVLLPIHIVFLELIIDPACSIVFEAELEEKDVMKRPPRNPKEPLFNRLTVGLSLLQGVSVFLIVFAVFLFTRKLGHDDLEARTLTFTTLIVSNLGLILINRSWTRTVLHTLRSKNTALWLVFGGAIIFMGLILCIPFLRQLFHFTSLTPTGILICLVAGAFSIIWFELLKTIRKIKA